MLKDRFYHPKEWQKKRELAHKHELNLYEIIMESFPQGVEAYLSTTANVGLGPDAQISFPLEATEEDVRKACAWLARLAGHKLKEKTSDGEVTWSATFEGEVDWQDRPEAEPRKNKVDYDISVVYKVKETDVCVVIPVKETREITTYKRLCPGDEGYETALNEKKKKEKEVVDSDFAEVEEV
jgi:hypothetical protein